MQPHPAQLTDFLPTTRKEMALRGWDAADIILLSADAYVDHPSFAAAVIGRVLEAEGFRVAIIPQPDWRGDLRDFSRLGRPRLFFGIAPGAMDSMVNKYTAARRLRSDDAYSPDGRAGLRPDYPTIVYTQCVRRLYPDVPVVLGGIEASLRRLAHYDYWQQTLRPSIICDSGADLIVYGMGELPMTELAHRAQEMLDSAHPALAYDADGYALLTCEAMREAVLSPTPLPQTVTLHTSRDDIPGGIKTTDLVLHSFEDAMKSPRCHAENFAVIERESNRWQSASRIIQQTANSWVVVNPPFPPMTTEQIDHSFDLPYTRLPHPKYNGHRIPAYEMIRHSICLHRGCFGGCAFCTISAHQGKFVSSRSKESIMREVEAVVSMPDFHGTISDLGGPSANMYRMHGRKQTACRHCTRPSCVAPDICPNLEGDHTPLLDIYRSVAAHPAVRHAYIGSGVRYDLLLHDWGNPQLNQAARDYTRQLILHHVSGRLKVAPEHTSDNVLRLMRKPSFQLFHRFKGIFDSICHKAGLRQQVIPYFISSHPGCRPEDMAELAVATKEMDFHLEQVQDFTPTPMTTATTMFATGFDPNTMQRIFVARSPEQKQAQRMFFFWYKPEERRHIEAELRRMRRPDLIARLYSRAAK